MTKCVLCNKEVLEVCNSCFDFLKWKYPTRYEEKIADLKALQEETSELNARGGKNE